MPNNLAARRKFSALGRSPEADIERINPVAQSEPCSVRRYYSPWNCALAKLNPSPSDRAAQNLQA